MKRPVFSTANPKVTGSNPVGRTRRIKDSASLAESFFVSIGVDSGVRQRRSSGLHVVPLHVPQFVLRDEIVALENGHRSVSAHGHDLEVCVSSKTQVVDRAVTQIMEREVR